MRFLLSAFSPPSPPKETSKESKNLQDMNYGLLQYLVFFQSCFGSLTSMWTTETPCFCWSEEIGFRIVPSSGQMWAPTWQMPYLRLAWHRVRAVRVAGQERPISPEFTRGLLGGGSSNYIHIKPWDSFRSSMFIYLEAPLSTEEQLIITLSCRFTLGKGGSNQGLSRMLPAASINRCISHLVFSCLNTLKTTSVTLMNRDWEKEGERDPGSQIPHLFIMPEGSPRLHVKESLERNLIAYQHRLWVQAPAWTTFYI